MEKSYWIETKWFEKDGYAQYKSELQVLEVRGGKYKKFSVCDVDVNITRLNSEDPICIDGVMYELESICTNQHEDNYDPAFPINTGRLRIRKPVLNIVTPRPTSGIIYITVWNTETYKDYQGHSIVELGDNIKSEHTRKVAEWIMETLGEGDHRCIVKVDIVGDNASFEMIDSKTIKD